MSQVSIIIPTYNRVKLLHSAITSVLNQTFQDFEILVIDDASTDNTREVISRYRDTRIKYIHHEVNKGEAGSRNTGILHSHAEYIAFLDDDDEWLPEKLQLQIDLFNSCQQEIGVIYTGYLRVDWTKKKILKQTVPIKRGYIYNDMFIQNYVGIPSTIILRRKCFDLVGLFDGSLPYGTDYDMWIRLAKEFHFDYIREPLVKYCVHQERISSHLDARINGLEILLKRYNHLFAANSKRHSYYHSHIGMMYCSIGSIKKGRELLLKAIKIYPLGIRGYLCFVLFLLGKNNFRRVKKIIYFLRSTGFYFTHRDRR